MKKKIFSLSLLSLLISGCQGAINLRFVPIDKYVQEHNYVIDYEDEHFIRYSKSNSVVTEIAEINNISNLLENNKTGRKRETLLSKGDINLLVVPVYFTDSDTSLLEKKSIFIENAFFGDHKMTNYDSVAGYYNKSSYGTLRIKGEVAPWYNIGVASSNWKSISSSYMNASSIIAEKAIDKIKEDKSIDLSKYDLDNDDNIDGVYLIYDHPYVSSNNKSNEDNLFWAYTYYTYQGENGYNNIAPYLNNYSWTSVDTIIQKDNRSYTNYLIHETGHLLGLSDYYNTHYIYDDYGGRDYHYQPLGLFDMMDYNIGDHSAFSKYLLNWSSPLVVKEGVNFKYKLKPFITSGDYLLIPSKKYNNSPFSEYLLVEYFIPEGLNRFSGQFSYMDKNGNKGIYTYPEYHGLKIYHVNATLGYYTLGSINSSLLATVDDPNYQEKIAGKSVALDYAYNNSINDEQANKDYPVLYHLLESSGSNTFKDSVPANNDTLFRLGDDFGITTFKDFTFNDGSKTTFTLKVEAISTKEITISITR